MNKRNGRLFAVKSTHHSISSLQNDHHILRSLDSPYVVRCLGHDFTHENGLPNFYLFMEYMPGGSIADLLKKFQGRFQESIVRSYTRSILHGIHYLHSQGIVHRDMWLHQHSGGSAKRINDDATLPLRGTPLWMAPEVLNHQEQGISSDIWSLGCTVLEMATGRPPWTHVSHPLAAIYHIASTHDLPDFPSSISPQGRDFLEKCFRRDPKQRWTAAQLPTHPFVNNDLCPPKRKTHMEVLLCLLTVFSIVVPCNPGICILLHSPRLFPFCHCLRICSLQRKDENTIRRKGEQLMSKAQGLFPDNECFNWQLAVKWKGPIGFQAPLLNGLSSSLLKPTSPALSMASSPRTFRLPRRILSSPTLSQSNAWNRRFLSRKPSVDRFTAP